MKSMSKTQVPNPKAIKNNALLSLCLKRFRYQLILAPNTKNHYYRITEIPSYLTVPFVFDNVFGQADYPRCK